MSNLQKMIVLHPELYNKLKNNFINDTELSQLDKNMKDILRNSKISDLQKWYLYRQNLIKFAAKKRQQRVPNLSIKSNNKNLFINEGTQTRPEPRKKDSATTMDTITSKSVGIQTFPAEHENESIFEYNPAPVNVPVDMDVDENIDQIFHDNDEIANLALTATPVGRRLKERKSINSNDFRMFETEAGDVITVPLFERPDKTIATKRYNLRLPNKKGDTQTTLSYPIRKSKLKTTSESDSSTRKTLTYSDLAKWTPYK